MKKIILGILILILINQVLGLGFYPAKTNVDDLNKTYSLTIIGNDNVSISGSKFIILNETNFEINESRKIEFKLNKSNIDKNYGEIIISNDQNSEITSVSLRLIHKVYLNDDLNYTKVGVIREQKKEKEDVLNENKSNLPLILLIILVFFIVISLKNRNI